MQLAKKAALESQLLLEAVLEAIEEALCNKDGNFEELGQQVLIHIYRYILIYIYLYY